MAEVLAGPGVKIASAVTGRRTGRASDDPQVVADQRSPNAILVAAMTIRAFAFARDYRIGLITIPVASFG